MAFRDLGKTGSPCLGKFAAILDRKGVLVVPILFLLTGISTKSQDPLSINKPSPSLSEQGKKPTGGTVLEAFNESSEPRRRSLFGRIQHYVGTHKELLAADSVLWIAQGADAGVTAHCISVSRACMETNPIVGPRPSPGQLFGGVVLIAGTATILTHLAWHLESDSPLRHMIWVSSAIFAIRSGMATYNNVEETNRLQQARARLFISRDRSFSISKPSRVYDQLVDKKHWR